MTRGIKIEHQEFVNKFYQIHPKLILIDVYKNMKTSIRFKDEFDIIYISKPQDLLMGKIPTIQCAIDKNDAFMKKAKFIHGDKYIYNKSIYKNARLPIIIECKKHGEFITIPDCHLNMKHGCPVCGKLSSELKRSLTTSAGWSKSSWKELGEKSKKFSGFKFYIIECYNNNERFFKIGRTFHNLKKRFEDKNKMPYNWKIHYLKEGECDKIYDIEREIYRLLKQFKYKPNNKFPGETECFKISPEYLNTLVDKIFNEIDVEL